MIRSSGFVGANYIEADEGFSKKDFLKQMRIAQKEARESRHWLRLLDVREDEKLERNRIELEQESDQLLRILSSMINKSM